MVHRLRTVLTCGLFICLFVTGSLLINSQIEHGEAALTLDQISPSQLESRDVPIDGGEGEIRQALAEPTTLPKITYSNISGVSGYEIGIFGDGYGESAGTVTILGAPATIVEWENGFIRAVVPDVTDGVGELRVVRQGGDAVTAPFTVYTIDPTFLQPAEKTFEEISFDKTLYLDGVEFAYCNDINNGAPIPTGRFLTNYRCGSGGFIGSGEAVFATDSSLGTTATLAFKSDTVLSGEHVFQFVSDTYWEPYHESQASWRKSYPRTYTIDISADSTNGTDGTWTTLETVADNNRTTRYHTVNIPSNGNYNWIRIHVTDGYADYSQPAGRDFLLREIHIYKASGAGRPDSFAIYGDSLTYSAFDLIGPTGFSGQSQQRRLSAGALPLTVYGLPGAKADRLMDTTYFDSDIYDAFAIDNMTNNALYWGIALGTNDIGGGAVNLGDPNSFLMQFDERLEAGVQELINRGRVPMIARIPDTNEAAGGYGDTPSKQKVLADIDNIAATYRLIPGPDLFTEFRRDIFTNNASYIGADGTHHTYEGRVVLVNEWVEAFTAPFAQNPILPTPEPTVTSPVPTATTPPSATATPSGSNPTPVPTPSVQPPDNGIEIEIANQASVIGYEIGIFGSGFGSVAGTVTILDANAQIIEWTDTFVRVVVPAVADGVGELHLTSAAGLNAYSPFTVYTINPVFRQAPEVRFQNIAAGRFVHTQNLESWFCYQQPANSAANPSEFLTDYRCGHNGITRTGSAKFLADSSLNEVAIVAVDLLQALSGDYYFSYFVNGSWYPRPDTGTYPESNPRDYELQVSADSTNGIDGTWQTVLAITGNDRSQRTHKLTVPEGGYHWLRMRVTDGNADETAELGRDFGLREIRLFAPIGNSVGSLDSFVIYGDSLTASNFETIGTLGLAAQIKAQRGENQDMMLTTFGLSGQNSGGLINRTEISYDIYDALALDNMQSNAKFWGIAIGTNDALDSESSIGIPGFNITEYGGRLDAVVNELIALGRVPIVARIPDTNEGAGGFGTLATKRIVLSEIDRIAAKYRLVPGPDLYTEFRQNIESDNGSFLGGDGTHHSDTGMLKLIEMWGSAFVTAVPAVPGGDPLPTPIPTNTPDTPPTATPLPPTATPLPPTATPLPPTATNTPVPPTATNTPLPSTATNTPLPPTATSLPPTATSLPPTATPVPPTPIPSPTIPYVPVLGDVSCDIQRNTDDALYISEYVVEQRDAEMGCPISGPKLNLANCDVDGDGTCDIVDAMYIAQCESGISNSLCGDSEDNIVETAPRSLPNAQLKLSSDSDGHVAIVVDLPGRERFGSLIIDVAFDPTLVRPVGCEVDGELVGACNVSFSGDRVRLSSASFQRDRGNVNIGNVYFMPATYGVTSADITVSANKVTDYQGQVYSANDKVQTVSLTTVPTVVSLGASNVSGVASWMQSLRTIVMTISLSLILAGILLYTFVGLKR